LLGNFTKEINLKVLKDLDVLENAPIKECPHLDLQVFIQYRKYLFLVDLNILFAIQHILEISANLQSQLLWDLFSDKELVDIGHLFFVLSGIHIVARYQATYGTDSVCVDNT
jgi:hypothetical protein